MAELCFLTPLDIQIPPEDVSWCIWGGPNTFPYPEKLWWEDYLYVSFLRPQ